MQYRYEALNHDDFQRLIQALLAHLLGPGLVAMPLGEADGGRDAQLRTLVVQVKFTRSPEAVDEPAKWLLKEVKRESDKIRRLAKRGVRHYLLVTNVRGTGTLDQGTIDHLDRELRHHAEALGLDRMWSWWRDGVDRRLDAAPPSLKLTYSAVLPGDQIMALTLADQADRSLLDRLATRWHQTRLEEDLLRGQTLLHTQRDLAGKDHREQVRTFVAASAELHDRRSRERADKIIELVEKLPDEEADLAATLAQTVIEEIAATRRAQFNLWALTARPNVWRLMVGRVDGHLTQVSWLSGGGYRTVDSNNRVATWASDGTLLETRRYGDPFSGQCVLSGDGEYLHHAGGLWRLSDGIRLGDAGRRAAERWMPRRWKALGRQWLPDNTLAVAPDPGRFVQLAIRGDQLVRIRETEVPEVRYGEWSPDGQRLAVVVEDAATGRTSVHLCAAADPSRTIRVFGNTNQDVRQAVWSPDGRLIAILTANHRGGSSPYSVGVYTRGGRRTAAWPGSNTPNLCWSPDSRLLASGSGQYDNMIEIRDARTGRHLAEAAASNWHINDLWWSPDATTLVAQDPESSWAWTLDRPADDAITITGAYLLFDRHTADTASWAPHGSHAVIRSGDAAFVVSRSTPPRLIDDGVRDVAFSPAGTLIAAARAGAVHLWPTNGGVAQDVGYSDIHGVVWSPDGRRLAMVHVPDDEERDGIADKVLVFDVERGQLSCEIDLKTWNWYVAWSPDGQLLAVPRGDEIVVYDTTSGNEHTRLRNPRGGTTAIAWSPDGDRIAAITDEGLKTWTVTHNDTGSVVGPASHESRLCWSPDATMAAAAAYEHGAGIDVWDLQSGSHHRFDIDELVVDLTWTDRLKAVLSDGRVLTWPTPGRRGRRTARRLTEEQRRRFGLDPEPALGDVLDFSGLAP
ncbi:WD40 repeat domain-containing protein [Actinoplanes missouriensis]|uniref:WD40 repeat domain-containing protein n=1 Tax=Actinoplanes missouriensis TaxID=1866 RepID=UPI0036993E8A